MGVKNKPNTIDKFRSAFRRQRRAFDVPGIDVTLYFPALTTAAQIAVAERLGEKPDEETERAWSYRRNVVLLIHQAELEDGSKAFAFGDMQYLLDSVDYTTMERMLTEMYMAGMPDAPKDTEEGKGGSATTGNSGS